MHGSPLTNKLGQRIRRFIAPTIVSGLLAIEPFRSRPQRYVLLLAHMRSGSSLLLHILASNPDIAGIGERNSPYETPRDLARLALRARVRNRLLLRPPVYVVDQINHSRLVRSADLLSRPDVWCIYLLRRPAAAISSMTDVLGRFYGMGLDEACSYYRQRLTGLARTAESADAPSRAFVLTYDDLTADAPATLNAIGEFLGLRVALSERYRLFDFTGQLGDPSREIFAGRIVSTDRPIDPGLDAHRLAELDSCYEQALYRLADHCGYAAIRHGAAPINRGGHVTR